MTTNIGHGERGRMIPYEVYKDGEVVLTVKAKRYSRGMIIESCRRSGIESPVIVRWSTAHGWGWNYMGREVIWEE